MKKIVTTLMVLCMLASLTACKKAANQDATTGKTNEELAKQYSASIIELSDTGITVDGEAISSKEEDAVYVANDIVFYLEGQDFTYGEGTKDDEHPQEEADKHTVIHITKLGNYVVSGTLSAGQIAVDLGKDADEDLDARVTLILNNLDITCSVAPGVIFYNVYECGDKEEEDADKDVNTVGAGANVILADGSVNTVNGSYVARIYKSVELNEAGTEVVDSKKLHKYDAAFYSKRSMNINGDEVGTGVLNINAENEGLDTELHLTINGGTININSGNDGINTNEDGISVTTINGGNLNIVVNGSTGEGDGIDSNGWLVINGGTVTSAAYGKSMDSGIDSDKGIHMNGGTVIATGNMLDEIAESESTYAVFSAMESAEEGATYTLKNEKGDVVCEYTAPNAFTYLVMSSEELKEGTYTLWKNDVQMSVAKTEGNMPGMMMPGGGFPGGEFPGGEFPDGERPQMPEGEFPEGEFPGGGFPGGDFAGGEFKGGERPQMPEGEFPEGEFPGGGFPGGDFKGGGFPGGNWGADMRDMEMMTEVEIADGGNMYVMTESK